MLEKQRKKIDEIDQELVRLFEERTHTIEEVAKIKLENDMEILDSAREDQVIKKVQGYLENPELKGELADLYTNVLRISRGHQKEWIEEQNK